ncbi:MAG TPA: hemerythrin domain-containing protein [Clostridiales bacterium]|jgi:hypothetical protein|nr:hemerythrin domain-containing protein [Clostridiales bacterium]
MNLNNYLEQHKRVEAEITTIKSLLKIDDIEENAGEMARHISTLAGIIKIHLSMEDKYLYPGLQDSEDEGVKELAIDYQNEMGDLAEKFVLYKDKYNTKTKILLNQSSLNQDTTDILQAIEKRLQREEDELYKFIEN